MQLVICDAGRRRMAIRWERLGLRWLAMRNRFAEQKDRVREIYLARHENSRYWVDFADFHFFRLQPVDMYYVGGFGVMGGSARRTTRGRSLIRWLKRRRASWRT